MSRRDREAEMIDVTVTFKRATDKALLVNDGDRDIWLPLSQVKCDEDLRTADEGDVLELLVPEWLAKEKGLI